MFERFAAPRWLGIRQQSANYDPPAVPSPEVYPDSPVVYPFGAIGSPRSPFRDTESNPSQSSHNQLAQGESDGMLDRIAASFGQALAGLGIRPARSRENSTESEKSAGRQNKYGLGVLARKNEH
jgi:hypothetical protein